MFATARKFPELGVGGGAEIPDAASIERTATDNELGLDGFTLIDPDGGFIRQGEQVHGYVNVCPHTASPLDWVENQFMSLDKSHIMCATHGAEFRIEDGFCVMGPCRGQSLDSISVSVRDGDVVLD